MHPSLQLLFDQIESQREVVLKPMHSLSKEKLNLQPATGKWSAAEVLSHLISAERMSVVYMTRKIQGIDQATRSGAWEAIKILILIVSQRLPGLRFKAPRSVVEGTTPLTSVTEIEQTWAEIRKELRGLLDRIPPHQINRMIYKHPAAGYLDARHALVFFREHVIHHTPQLQKLLK